MSLLTILIPADSKKRSRTPTTDEKDKPVKVEEDAEEEDDAPPVKRARRARNRVEEDEDDVEVEVEAEVKKESKPEAKATKKSPTPEPAVKEEEDKVMDESDAESTASNSDASDVSDAEANDEEDPTDKGKKAAVKKKATKKALSKVQTTLTSKATKDPYPDWKAGQPVPYAALCTTFSLVEMTTKRLEIMAHCSLFLRQVMRLTPDDLLPTVLLMINKLAPDYAGIELGIGESLIMKAIGESTGRSLQIVKKDQKEIGDLGLVAVKSRATQKTMFQQKALTIRGVHKGLMGIATVTGNGAQGKKVDMIKKLLSAADSHATGKVDITKDKGGPSEAKYLVRFLEGKLRLGLAERTVLVSLAQAVVNHEASQKGKAVSTTDIEEAEAMLKTVYR
jgi:DNA ligase-1